MAILSCEHRADVNMCDACADRIPHMNPHTHDVSFLYPPSNARTVASSMGEALKADVMAAQMDNVRLAMAAEVCEAQGFREVAASLRKLARQ